MCKAAYHFLKVEIPCPIVVVIPQSAPDFAHHVKSLSDPAIRIILNDKGQKIGLGYTEVGIAGIIQGKFQSAHSCFKKAVS